MNIARLRIGLYYTSLAMVVVNIVGGLLLLPVELGYSAAFVVGTALLAAPLWGMQGILVLFFSKHYNSREYILSVASCLYMASLLVISFMVAKAVNFP